MAVFALGAEDEFRRGAFLADIRVAAHVAPPRELVAHVQVVRRGPGNLLDWGRHPPSRGSWEICGPADRDVFRYGPGAPAPRP